MSPLHVLFWGQRLGAWGGKAEARAAIELTLNFWQTTHHARYGVPRYLLHIHYSRVHTDLEALRCFAQSRCKLSAQSGAQSTVTYSPPCPASSPIIQSSQKTMDVIKASFSCCLSDNSLILYCIHFQFTYNITPDTEHQTLPSPHRPHLQMLPPSTISILLESPCRRPPFSLLQ